MKQLIFGFSRPKKWKPFAAAIMWRDDTNISHGYTKFVSLSWGVGFIYQNAGHATHFMGQENFERINIPVEEYMLEVSEEVEAKIGKMCVEREGKPYAMKQVTGQILTNLLSVISFGKIQVKNPFGDGDETTNCIEEQARIISEALGVQSPFNFNDVSVKTYREWVAGLPLVKVRTQ